MTVLSTTRSQFSLEVPASAAAVKGLRKFHGFGPSSFAASVLHVVVALVVVVCFGVVRACVGGLSSCSLGMQELRTIIPIGRGNPEVPADAVLLIAQILCTEPVPAAGEPLIEDAELEDAKFSSHWTATCRVEDISASSEIIIVLFGALIVPRIAVDEFVLPA
jgi:hypothetical protein